MTVGERVKELRKNILGLSMEAFGEKLGVKKAAISNIENGNRNLTEQMAKSICREYRVNYFWLTEGDGEPFVDLPETTLDELCVEYELDEYEKSIIFEYLKLSKDERSVIKKYISNIKKGALTLLYKKMMCDFENFIQLLQVHLVEHLNDLFLNFFFLHLLVPLSSFSFILSNIWD